MTNNENGKGKNYMNKGRDREELNLGRILNILNRRKNILFGCIAFTLILVLLYNSLSKPVYESTAVLKKEKTEKENPNDQLSDVLNLKTQDEIETEVELVKTWEVLSKTIEELDLYLTVDKIVDRDGNTISVNQPLSEYNQLYNIGKNSGNSKLPQVLESKLTPSNKSYSLYVTKSIDNRFQLYNTANDSLLMSSVDGSAAQFKYDNLDLTLYWADVTPGSKFYFKIASFYDVLDKLKENVTVEQKLKTDVFTITVKAHTSYEAKLLANTITDKFRQARIDQQKQTVRYSYDFVDKNLDEIKKNLEDAENNLSQYKASHNIVDLPENSANLVKSVSDLEAEKLSNDLQLTEYKNKLYELKNEMNTKGYFDQSYLGSQGSDLGNSPFSAVMKQLSDLELKRLELLQKRTENHPEVQNIDEQIAQAKKKLSSYNENTLSSYQIMSNSLEKKGNQISGLLGQYEGRMHSLPAQESQLAALTRQSNVYNRMYTLLLDKREEMRIAELSKLQDIVIVDAAHNSIDPVAPKKLFNIMAGLIFGIVLGFASIFFVEVKNRKLVGLDDIENDFHLPIFALIPDYDKDLVKKIETSVEYEDRFVTLMDDQDGFKETYRVLRTKLSSAFEFDKKVLMFTSCEENTGKTTVVANLAISIAQAKYKVLVVDCDLKKGALSKAFNIPKDAPGLITYLKKNVDAPYIYNKVVRTLDILPAGGISENSSDLLSTDRMKNLLNTINSSSYDYILFDTPPVTRVVDALVLGKTIKDAIIVIRPDHSYKDSIAWGLQEMEQAKMVVHGTVINAAQIEKSSFKHRYGYGYGYKYSDNYYENTSSNGNGHSHEEKSARQKPVVSNV